MKLYGVNENGGSKYELEVVEAVEKPNSYVIDRKNTVSSYGYSSRIMKDDTRVALTPDEAWAKAIARANQEVVQCEARWQQAKERLKKVRAAHQAS